jgi:putative SOS response-associated peptidase YedK
MCNLYRLEKNIDAVRRLFADAGLPLDFPEGIPNLQPRDVRITDRAPIVRFNADKGQAELVERRWSWPAPNGKPVFNMRSDGREFGKDRCLVIADGFFEYTASADPAQKRKDCWLFKPPGDETFAIAGLVRSNPDVAAYHNRQIALLSPTQWPSWLDHSARSLELLRPSDAGSLVPAAA